MKKLFGLIFFLCVLHSYSFAQKESRLLEIYSITEYIDGYVIKAIDIPKSDTLNIISTKEVITNKHKFEKMTVGRKYNFEYEDYVNRMAAMPPENLIIRIKTTVVWRGTDEKTSRPFFARNLKGLWIKK